MLEKMFDNIDKVGGQYRPDCFAYNKNGRTRAERCRVLVEADCIGCRFFKTHYQYDMDAVKAKMRAAQAKANRIKKQAK